MVLALIESCADGLCVMGGVIYMGSLKTLRNGILVSCCLPVLLPLLSPIRWDASIQLSMHYDQFRREIFIVD